MQNHSHMERSYRYFEKISAKTRFLNLFRRIFQYSFLEKWLSDKTSGKSVDSFWAKLVPPEYLYRHGSQRIAIRGNSKYALDISDTVDHFIYFNFNDTAFNRLISMVKEDSVVIDVGANMGRFLLTFASIAKHGSVVGYEPDPVSYKKLSNNVSINSYANIILQNKALGNVAGKLSLARVNPHNAGMNRISLSGGNSLYDSIDIDVCVLDSEIASLGLNKVDIVKIDVEGFEFRALLGMQQTIHTFHPILFIELVDENLKDTGSSPEEIVLWLINNGYRVHAASSMKQIDKSSDLKDCHFDIICFPIQ